ncbi:MAG: glycosyltransferase family 4 protein [Desulfobulbaceae bacterium]|nr:glycosyltransferase family 4 protein [Desulfobulbaceae bacterium]
MPLGHILCLTSNFPRWQGDSTTNFVLHLAKDLQHIGWQVTVLAPHAKGAKCHETLDGIKVHRFRYLFPEGFETVCYQGGALINLRKNRFNYGKLPALVFFEWLKTISCLRSGKFDLLHSHWLLPQGFVGALAAGPLNIPHVCTIHGGDVFGLQGTLLNKFKAFAIRHTDAITVNSSATRQAVSSICRDYSPLHTIPMGVSPASAPQTTKIPPPLRQITGPIVLFIGRLVEEKGLTDLLEAFSLLHNRHQGITLVVIGDGQDRPLLEKQVRDLGLNEKVLFTGWLDANQIPAFLAAADIFVAPSRTSPEGWVEAQGLSIIEAMMAELPVIATRTGGIVDSVEHNISGILIPERSPTELASAINKLLIHPELAKVLGQEARHKAITNFSRQSSAAKFSELFKSLIKDKKASTKQGS